MLAELFLGALVVAVALAVAIDLAKVSTEVPDEQPGGLVHHAGPPRPARAGRGTHGVAPPPEPPRAAAPVAEYEAGPARPPASIVSSTDLGAILVRLSRRNQGLAERQARLIGNLEQAEQDRDRLASLFSANRIATCMYRSSQNLLVLAGYDISRAWNQPMPLVKLIRIAASGIEDYDRVVLNAPPDAVVSGRAVNDLAHLLAELIENATSFSAGTMPVVISGQVLNGGGVVVGITDRGFGMSANEMAYANWRLGNPSAVDATVPSMGLFVVGRLAARHSVGVRLQQAELGGVTALVWLPSDVLAYQDAAVPQTASDPGRTGPRRGSREAAADPGRRAAEPDEATAGRRRLPIFEAVESRWSGSGHQMPGSPAGTPPAGSSWPYPADDEAGPGGEDGS